jgi:hypothetical protein
MPDLETNLLKFELGISNDLQKPASLFVGGDNNFSLYHTVIRIYQYSMLD